MNHNSLRILFFAFTFSTLFCSCNGQISAPVDEAKEEVLLVNYSELEFKDQNPENLAYYNNELFTGWSVIYTKGEVKYIEQQYVNGKKDGIWRVYFPSGVLQKEGQMVNGLDNGTYKEYYSNGNLQYHYEYDMGKKVGKWLSWYEDGTPYTERNFTNDQINGKVYVWDETGKLAKEYDYHNNVMTNSIMHFKENK